MTIARFFSSLWSGVERRQHPRLREPAITLVIEGRKVKTIDWSLGGCLIVAADLGPPSRHVGEKLGGTLRLAKVPKGEFMAEVVRKTDRGELGLRWLEFTGATFLGMTSTYG